MYFELPDCRRCCLCVPLRHGILIFGYLNLVFSLFIICVDIFLDMTYPSTSNLSFLYRGVGMYAQLWFCYFLYILEVIFNVVLLVGAHKKNTRLIRVYYYYGVVTTLASFLTYIVVVRKVPFGKNEVENFNDPIQFCLALSGLALQCYLLLLIRTELNKLHYQDGPFRYVNHVAEVVVDPIPGVGEGREGHAL